MTASETIWQRLPDGSVVGSWWQPASKPGRLDCLLCPRQCSLADGDRGFCFVRENRQGQIVLSTYGRSTGFCIDPIEKKPLNHFYPGTSVLSFGTAGCNLGCQFCQNWDISKSREVERLSEVADPDVIARAAKDSGCTSVAFTYNDPVVWAEYAIDTARSCRQLGIHTVAVTAGYINSEAREPFFQWMDAANVDLKGFTEEFYRQITYSHLQPVLETLRYLANETQVWLELTNLLIPDLNDQPDDLRRMCDWILEALGDQVPIHFTAFHPDFRMLNRRRTDPESLLHAYDLASQSGLKYVYVGNVHDRQHQSTYCPSCTALLIERDWYQLGRYAIQALDDSGNGRCMHCRTSVPGRFAAQPGTWGGQRQPIRISQFADSERLAPVIAQSLKEEPMSNSPSKPLPKSASVAGSPETLQLDRLTSGQRQTCLQLAASSVATAVTGQPIKTPPESLSEFVQSIVMGAFVTLRRGHLLRGCCGVLGKPMALGSAISSAALRTAREDQRMAPISPCELAYLDLEVTLLGPLQHISGAATKRAESVEIGKHGLMIRRGQASGLLLPSVATERGWNATEFLQAVCQKAQLPTDSWLKEDAELFRFDGLSMSIGLKELLPIGLPISGPLPLSLDELRGYAQVAAENIAAFACGGTPSYVVPYLPDQSVNALVLSMEWGPEPNDHQPSAVPVQQGNAIQVSFRPGIPLQSNLYQMCQRITSMLAQQQFSGQLTLGLTLGFDPAFHGYGGQADLAGVDTTVRAIIVSDQRHCALAYDPNQSAEQLLNQLQSALPVGSKEGWVHSVQVMSTLPRVFSLSVPTPILAQGTRAPAVAGQFYPAEDAARRAMVSEVCDTSTGQTQSVLAAMVPHAGLKYSGHIAAKVWQSIELKPNRTVLVISPKHTAQGVNWAICPHDSWALSATTTIAGDPELASQMAQHVPAFQLDAAAHASEHGIEVQLPILEQIAPGIKVVGVAMHAGSWSEIKSAAEKMADWLQSLDNPPLLVISSDMNHFADDAENRRRDRMALDAMASGDPERLLDVCRQHEISMCGVVPAALVMETLRQMGHGLNIRQLDYSTSADVSGDKSRVVGYAGLILT